jgi:hypothetical protein
MLLKGRTGGKDYGIVGLADTEGDGRREQLYLRNTQRQRYITCSPQILTLLVMVTASTSNILQV